VEEFRRRYNEALRACPVNHSRLDYLCAKAEGKADTPDRALLWVRTEWNIYGLYSLFLAVPPLLWWLNR
jgi:hypothetical protein